MYFTAEQLINFGFSKIGKNCKISKKASFYNVSGSIGNNVRIDDDVILKGNISLSSYVHLARGCTLSGGKKGIFIEKLTAISNFVQIFSSSDDYFYSAIPSVALEPKMREKYSKIISKKINIGKCVLIGSMSIILPGANIKNFSSVGALCIVRKMIPEGFYFSNRNELKKRDIKKLKKIFRKINMEL